MNSFSGKQLGSVRKETHVVSVMTQWPLATVALVRDGKDDPLLPHPIRRQGRPLVKNATEMKALKKKGQILCRYKN